MLERSEKLDCAPDSLRTVPVSTNDVRGSRQYGDPLAWDHGPMPKGWKLFLMRIAGVDPSIARMVPLDEQQQIWRVGAAVLFGSAMQVICFSVAMQLAFGVSGPARLACAGATFVICGILYLLDAKFVAADWKAHGMALARARGLIEGGTTWERCQRPVAAIVRWTCSVFIASTLATFVLLQVFKPDIERQWRFDHQRVNAALLKDVAEQHSALVRLAEATLGKTRKMLDGLTKERSGHVEASPNTADADAQIAQAVESVARLRKARDAAWARLRERESDAVAERFGVIEKAKHSGQAGSGKRYQSHMENARLLRESIAALSGELDELESQIVQLRQSREKVLSDARQAAAIRVAALDARLAETLERFQRELRQRDDLAGNRAEWIEREARQSARYVPMPQGLTDQLTALWGLAARSTGIFGLILGTKALIMLLESAGPLAKFFFTTPGIYGLYAAMRVHDAVDVEAAWRKPGGDTGAGLCGLGGGRGAADRAPSGHAGRRWPFGEKLGAEKPQAAE
jgi:hypothetical protein